MSKVYSTLSVCMSDYADMSYEEKYNLANESYYKLLDFLGPIKDTSRIGMTIAFFGVLIRSDPYLYEKGIKLVNDIYKSELVTKEYLSGQFKEYYDKSKTAIENDLKGFILDLPHSMQLEMVTMALATLTIDGRWANYERSKVFKVLFDEDKYFETIYRSFSD